MWGPQPFEAGSRLYTTQRCAWLVVDLQSQLLGAFAEAQKRDLWHAHRLVAGVAARFDVPIVVTEHCAEKIGATHTDFAALAPSATVVAKQSFGGMREPELRRAVETVARPDWIVSGVEAHICVLQSAAGLLEAGYRVAVLRDASASVIAMDHDAALTRLHTMGATIMTSEMLAYEWLRRGDDPYQRELLRMVKERRTALQSPS